MVQVIEDGKVCFGIRTIPTPRLYSDPSPFKSERKMEPIDVRGKSELQLLEHCTDCDQDFVANLHIRHCCGCYLKKEWSNGWNNKTNWCFIFLAGLICAAYFGYLLAEWLSKK